MTWKTTENVSRTNGTAAAERFRRRHEKLKFGNMHLLHRTYYCDCIRSCGHEDGVGISNSRAGMVVGMFQASMHARTTQRTRALRLIVVELSDHKNPVRNRPKRDCRREFDNRSRPGAAFARSAPRQQVGRVMPRLSIQFTL